MKTLGAVGVNVFDLQKDTLTEALKGVCMHLPQNFPIRLFDFAHHCFSTY